MSTTHTDNNISQQTTQHTFVTRVDAVDWVKLRINGIVKLHFAHADDPLDYVFNKYFFWHAVRRHYIQCRQSSIECRLHPFECQLSPQVIVFIVAILQTDAKHMYIWIKQIQMHHNHIQSSMKLWIIKYCIWSTSNYQMCLKNFLFTKCTDTTISVTA